MAAVEAYVANLYWLNTGKAGPEPLALPTDYNTAQALFRRLGVADGEHDMVITETHSDISGLDAHITEYDNLDEMNYLAALVDDLDEYEIRVFEAAIESGEYTSDLGSLINLAQNLGCYTLYTDVQSAEELGEMILNDSTIPEHLQGYIDFEAYGEDISTNEGGVFSQHGYIYNNQSDFVKYYDGRDIPEEHRIFTRPEKAAPQQARPPSIIATLEECQKRVDSQGHTEQPRPAAHEAR